MVAACDWKVRVLLCRVSKDPVSVEVCVCMRVCVRVCVRAHACALCGWWWQHFNQT